MIIAEKKKWIEFGIKTPLTWYGSSVSNPRTTSANFPSQRKHKKKISEQAFTVEMQKRFDLWYAIDLVNYHLCLVRIKRWWCIRNWRLWLAWCHCWVRRSLPLPLNCLKCSCLFLLLLPLVWSNSGEEERRIVERETTVELDLNGPSLCPDLFDLILLR